MTDSLDVLLKMARTHRDAASQAVSTATRQVADLQERLARVEATALSVRVDGDSAFAVGTFLAHLHRRQRELRDEIRGSETHLQQAQQRLMVAYTEYKKLQLVKEHENERSARRQRKQEEHALDEIATQKHGRHSSSH